VSPHAEAGIHRINRFGFCVLLNKTTYRLLFEMQNCPVKARQKYWFARIDGNGRRWGF
jgi:hypothetical protein